MPDFRDRIDERAERIKTDLGHAMNGNFDRISDATRREVAEAVRDHMQGRSRVEVPVNDRVTIEGRREKDGTIIGSLKFDLP